MQQKDHEGDFDIINEVVRAAGVGPQPYKRCHEQNVEGERRGKVKHPRKEPDDAETDADEAAEKEDTQFCKDMFDDRSQENRRELARWYII